MTPSPPTVTSRREKKHAGAGGVGGGSKTYVHPVFSLDPAWVIALANAPDRELRRLEATRAEPAHEDFAALYDDEDGEDAAERMLSISPNRRVRDDADGDKEDIGDVVWCGIVI